jgi:hypothetical protein
VEEIEMKTTHDVGKETVDVLESLIVGPQCFDELRRRLHELLWQHGAADVLQ